MTPPPDLTIDRLRVAELAEVMPVERASYNTPWSVAMFVLELTRPETIALGARVGGRLAGYIVCSPQADEWHVMNVTVGPSHRRQGLARALISRLHEILDGATAGRARTTLEVRPSNKAAFELYASEGYLVAGRRRAYYPDDGEDALIMWRTPATQAGSFDDVPFPDLAEAKRWNSPSPQAVGADPAVVPGAAGASGSAPDVTDTGGGEDGERRTAAG